MRATVARGDIWEAEFGPVRGQKQAGRRPAVILSSDIFNRGPSQLVVAIPLTSRHRRLRLHVAVEPPEGGLSTLSFIMCEQVRVLAIERLLHRRGSVSPTTLRDVEERVRILLDL